METTKARRESKDVLFRRIGEDLPVGEGSGAFDGANAPVRGLAVSNRFGISFFVHSAGFVITQTSILVNLAQQAKDGASGKTAQQGCYLNVPVPGVRILCLSKDELTLAACVGDQIVHLYDVPTLVHKLDRTPMEARYIPEGRLKDFRWSPADDEIYLLLSREGELFSGQVGEKPSRVVDSDVVAASWSPDGKYVACLSKERAVCIFNFKFESQYTFELPAEVDDVIDNLQVESLQWMRPDAMLVAYTQSNEDGEDDECPLILVTTGDGDFAKGGGTVTAVVFDNTFLSIDSRVLPSGSGPYMLAEYIKPWKMAIVASRRSVDDHIVILGWFSEERKHAVLRIKLNNDTWLPRFELQDNGDDNILLGLAIGMTTNDLQVTDPRDDSGDTKLSACPVLMCLSLGGKLSLFSVSRLDKSAAVAEFISPPILRESNSADLQSEVSVYRVAKGVETDTPSSQPARNTDAEGRVADEPSTSSGNDSDRDHDGCYNDEILSRFLAPGRFGTVSETVQAMGWLSPRISFSTGLVDKTPVRQVERIGCCGQKDQTSGDDRALEFEFSMGSSSQAPVPDSCMLPADELFHKGRLLPQCQHPFVPRQEKVSTSYSGPLDTMKTPFVGVAMPSERQHNSGVSKSGPLSREEMGFSGPLQRQERNQSRYSGPLDMRAGSPPRFSGPLGVRSVASSGAAPAEGGGKAKSQTWEKVIGLLRRARSDSHRDRLCPDREQSLPGGKQSTPMQKNSGSAASSLRLIFRRNSSIDKSAKGMSSEGCPSQTKCGVTSLSPTGAVTNVSASEGVGAWSAPDRAALFPAAVQDMSSRPAGLAAMHVASPVYPTCSGSETERGVETDMWSCSATDVDLRPCSVRNSWRMQETESSLEITFDKFEKVNATDGKKKAERVCGTTSAGANPSRIVLKNLERCSNPASKGGGKGQDQLRALRTREIRRSPERLATYTSSVRVTPVLNVPVCIAPAMRSSKAGKGRVSSLRSLFSFRKEKEQKGLLEPAMAV